MGWNRSTVREEFLSLLLHPRFNIDPACRKKKGVRMVRDCNYKGQERINKKGEINLHDYNKMTQ